MAVSETRRQGSVHVWHGDIRDDEPTGRPAGGILIKRIHP